MTQYVNITKQSNIADVMHDAAIVDRILSPHNAPFVHPLISWYVDPEQEATGDSDTVRFPRELPGTELDAAEMSYENPTVEGDDAGYGDPITFDTDSVECTPAIIGVKYQLTYKAGRVRKIQLQRLWDAGRIVLMKRIARDQAALQLTADNEGDNSGELLTRQIFGYEKAMFEEQQPNGPVVFVGTPGMIESLKEDIRDTVSSSIAMDPAMLEMLKSMGVYRGTLEGVPLFVSNYQPNPDAANDLGYFCTAGDGGALGIANMWAMDNVEDGIVGGFRMELEWEPDKDHWNMWIKSYLGHVITDQDNLRTVIARRRLAA